jgi:hypothetical protein
VVARQALLICRVAGENPVCGSSSGRSCVCAVRGAFAGGFEVVAAVLFGEVPVESVALVAAAERGVLRCAGRAGGVGAGAGPVIAGDAGAAAVENVSGVWAGLVGHGAETVGCQGVLGSVPDGVVAGAERESTGLAGGGAGPVLAFAVAVRVLKASRCDAFA